VIHLSRNGWKREEFRTPSGDDGLVVESYVVDNIVDVKISLPIKRGTWGASLSVTEDGRRRELVTVYRNLNIADWSLAPAQVNWSCIGATDPETAETMAVALLEAVEIARAWEKNK
jgi:hypothetical protein